MLDRIEKVVVVGAEIAVEGLRLWAWFAVAATAWMLWSHPEILAPLRAWF